MAVHQVNIFIARTVARGFKRCDDIAEPAFEARERPEGKLTDSGVQAIGANHEIEAPDRTMAELHGNAVRILIEAFDLRVEHDLARPLDLLEQQAGQFAAWQRDVPAAG